MSALVIRFSSLGDVVLAGGVTGALGEVEFFTKAAFAPVAALLPGVRKVHVWEDGLPQGDFERVVDLHASPRSRWVCARLGRPTSRVARHDLDRRLRVAFKVGDPPPTVLGRYAAAAGVQPAPVPWLNLPEAPREALLLCPAASHATKVWPAARFAELGRRWRGPVVVLGGPGELGLVRAVAEAVGSHAEAVAEAGVRRTVEALARGRAAVAGDTGLMHLAAAAGVPVVAIFGPTTSQDGFWDARAHTAGEAVERALSCRPCSLHGGPRCPVGDHLCLSELGVDEVWAALSRLAP